jgi:hypothetical protein
MLVLTTYVLQGFHTEQGNPRPAHAIAAWLRRLDLLDELEPDERAFLLSGGENVTADQVADAT